MWGFDGVRPTETEITVNFSGGREFAAPAAWVVGPIAYPADGIMRRHFSFLKAATRGTAKFTMLAPSMFRHRAGRSVISDQVYPDLDRFWSDLGKACNDAMRDFHALGCRHLQLDDVNSACLCDPAIRQRMRDQGDDPAKLLDAYIRANNAALAGRPADLTATLHMCRGNFRSGWIAAGGYDAVAEQHLAEMQVDGFFLEYDSDRAGDFAPLRFVPKGKTVVLGLMTSRTPELESKDEPKRRIDEATRHIALDQLCLSPQCGFSSTHHGNNLTADDQRRKLEHVVAVAEEVRGGA